MAKDNLLEKASAEAEYKIINEQKFQYWESILGKTVLSILLEKNENIRAYIKSEKSFCTLSFNQYVISREHHKQILEFEGLTWKRGIYFDSFYQPIIENAAGLVASELRDYKDYFDSQIYSDFSKQLAHRLQALCMRTLIKKMHECKDQKMLKGEDTKEEYEYFCSHMLRDEEYVKGIFEEFPILDRCVYEQTKNMADYYVEIVKYFVKDRIKIQEEWDSFSEYRQITGIRGGFADVHNQGRQVMEVCFENNRKLLYKPRSMENEKGFMDLLQWISTRTGTRQHQYAFLSFHDHSWTEMVEHASCGSKEELQRYYVRFGEQLFLTYLLGTKDLHSENLISAGEYPVLIDLETLVNLRNHKAPSTAEEEIQYQLFYSVLSTGLLPFYSWNKGGRGVDNSALGGKGGQKYPFRIPVIVN